ncbi:MAG: hypothetical protein JNL98_12730 [Bryobacterales bacterium]|nr:hypothetical protein [Bryobacterales bacterium]
MRSTLLSAGLAALSLLTFPAAAQDLTPTQFKALCENSPLNTFTVNTPVKILGTAPTVTAINTGCRVNFTLNGKIEADQAAFTFAGPLVFQAGPNAEVTLVKSFFSAPTVQITEGTSSSLILAESTVQATAGNITLALGALGKVDASLPFAGRQNALEAAGAISISGSSRAAFSLQNSSAVAGTNFSISFAGPEANLQVVNARITATAGPLSVIAPGQKANFDLSSSALIGGAGVTLVAQGREGHINMSQMQINAGSGAVRVEAVNTMGVIKMADATVVSGGGITVLAARNSTLGEAVVEVSNFSAQGAVRVESGSGGTTTVLNNRISSPTSITVFTPANGSCVAENNTAIAPVLRLCI